MADTSFGAFLDATDPTDEETVPASPFDVFADGVDVTRQPPSLIAAPTTNPDVFADHKRLSRDTGVALPVVEAQPEDVKTRQYSDSVEALTNDSPRTTEFLTTGENAKLAHDDFSALGALESAWDETKAIGQAYASSAISSLGMGVSGTAELVESGNAFLRKGLNELGVGEEYTKYISPDYLSDNFINPAEYVEKAGDLLQKVGEVTGPDPADTSFATDVAGALGQIVGQIAVVATNPALGTTLLFGMGAEQQAQRAEEFGAEELEQAGAVITGAAVTGISERLSLGFLTRYVPKSVLDKADQAFMRILQGAGVEGAQEAVEAFMHNFIAKVAYDPDADLTEGVVYEGGIAAVAGGIFTSLFVAGKRLDQSRQAKRHSEDATKRRDITRSSKLWQRDPEAYGELADKHMRDAGIDGVYIDVEEFDAYAEENNLDGVALAEEWGVSEQMEEARRTSGALKIPNDTYAAVVEPGDHFEAISSKLRMTYDAMTAEEAAVEREEHDAAIQASVEQIAADIAENVETPETLIYNDIVTQLEAAGQFTDVAATNARIFAATFTNLVGRAGQDPYTYFQQQGLTVEAAEFAPEVELAPAQEALAAAQEESTRRSQVVGELQVARDELAVAEPDSPRLAELDAQLVEAQAALTGSTAALAEASAAAEVEQPTLLQQTLDYDVPPEQLVQEVRAADGDLTDTPAFKRWFEGSKVVDEQGQPLVVHHGGLGISEAEEFDTEFGGQTTGNNEHGAFHFVDEFAVAEDYGRQSFIRRYQDDPQSLIDDGHLFVTEDFDFADIDDIYAFVEELAESKIETRAVYLNIQNPIVIDMKGERVDVDFVERLGRFVLTGIDDTGEFVDQYYDQLFGAHEQSDVDAYKDEIEERARDNYALEADEAIEAYQFADATNEVLQEQGIEPEHTPIDGIIIRNMIDDIGPASNIIADQYIAVTPPQIKSVLNVGAFDPTDPRILFQAEEGAPRGAFDPLTNVISLFENQDLTTFLHESAHYYLEVYKNLSRLPDAPVELQEDFAKIMAWTGGVVDADISREQHEQWARGFEAYVMEGKSPSVELEGVFARASAWLRIVYNDVIAKLGVELNDEIRSVMDRMVASSADIERASAVNSYTPLFTSALEAAMTELQFARYQEAIDTAQATAESTVRSKRMAEVLRETKTWWKEAHAKWSAKLLEDAQDDPLWNAINVLTKGVFLDGAETTTKVKLDKTEFIAVYGEDAVRQVPRGIWAKKDGMDSDTAAALLGFDSGEHLYNNLLAVPRNDEGKILTLKQFVNFRATEILRENHGTMNEMAAQEAANDALETDAVAAVLTKELRALHKQLPTGVKTRVLFARPPDAALIKKAAEEQVAEKKVSELHPAKYLAQSSKYARRAAKAVIDGDIEVAVDAKHKQLINHHMATAMRKAKDKVDKQIDRLKKYDRPAVRSKIEPAYIEALDELLEQYDLRKSVTLREIRARRAVQTLIDNAEKEGEPLSIDPRIAETAERKSYKDMTVSEVRALADAAANIAKVGRTAKDAKEGQLADLINEGIAVAEDNVEDRASEYLDKPSAFMKHGASILSYLTQVRTYFEELDGFVKGGWFDRHIMMPVREAEIERERRMLEEGALFRDVLFKHYGAGKEIKVAGVTVRQPMENIYARDSGAVIRGQRYTKEQMLSVALNHGNVDNLKALEESRDADGASIFTVGELNEILTQLTPADWAFVQDAWDHIDRFWPEIVELHKKMYGFAPPKVEASAVFVNGVQVAKGGYYPLKYDRDVSIAADANEVKQDLRDMDVGKFAPAQTRNGHTKERMGSGGAPVKLSLNVISGHIDQVVTDLTMHETIYDARLILGAPRMQQTLSRKVGINAVKQMDMWLKDVAVGGIRAGEGLEAIAKNLRTSTTIGTMAWKAATSLIQFTGLTHTVAELGPKWAAVGVTRFFDMRTTGRNPFRYTQEMSKFMADRVRLQNRDVADALRTMRKKSPELDAITSTYFFPIIKSQQLVDTITWIGAFEKSKSEGKTDAEASGIADSFVEASQGGGLMSSLSAFQRGTASESTRLSEWVKAWGTFYSYFAAKLNIVMRHTKKTNFRDPTQVAQLGSVYMLTFWLETALGEAMYSAIDDAFGADEPEEDKTWWEITKHHLGLAASTMAATIPVLGQVGSAVVGFTPQTAPARSLQEVGRGVTTAYKAFTDAIEYFKGEADIDLRRASIKTAIGVAGAVNVISPYKIPVAQMRIALQALEQKFDPLQEPPRAVDFLLRKPRE